MRLQLAGFTMGSISNYSCCPSVLDDIEWMADTIPVPAVVCHGCGRPTGTLYPYTAIVGGPTRLGTCCLPPEEDRRQLSLARRPLIFEGASVAWQTPR